jgi:hypothetical protein
MFERLNLWLAFILACFLPAFALIPTAADTGITVASSGGGDILPATVVRQIQQGEKVSNLIDEVAQLTYESGGQEHAIVSLQSGDRVIVSGGTGGINFGGMCYRFNWRHTFCRTGVITI